MKNNAVLYTLLAVLFFAMNGCATYTSVREHQNIQDSAKTIDSVVLLPPEVEIEKIVFTGDNESLDDKEELIADSIQELATSRLSSEGLNVIEFDFDTAIIEDEEFAYALTQCRESFNTAKQDLYDGTSVTVENKQKFKANIGPIVNTIAEKTGAESVLLMEYYGYKKSEGMVAKDIAASVLLGVLTGSVAATPSSGSMLNIALVDTASGDVLWTNTKAAPVLDESLVNTNFDEFPDIIWESEIATQEPQSN